MSIIKTRSMESGCKSGNFPFKTLNFPKFYGGDWKIRLFLTASLSLTYSQYLRLLLKILCNTM